MKFETYLGKQSAVVTLAFSLCLGLLFYSAHYFRVDVKAPSPTQELKLIPNLALEDAQQILFNNTNGEYQIQKMESDWYLLTPHKVKVNQSFIKKLISSFQNAKIIKQIAEDKNNITNLNFSHPTEITFILNNGKQLNFKVGLVNSIDKTAYIRPALQGSISHVDSFDVSLENINYQELLEKNIFTFDLSNLVTISFSPTTTGTTLQQQNGNWSQQNMTSDLYSKDKITNWFMQLKSVIPLDVISFPTDKQIAAINQISKNVQNQIIFKLNDQSEYTYTITGLKSIDIPDTFNKGENYFLVFINNAPPYYLIPETHLGIFNQKAKDLK